MNGEEGIKRRAAALFAEQQQSVFKRTDRLFAGLMVFQWAAGIIAALLLSPKTWRGSENWSHINIWAAIFLGAAIISLPVYLALKHPGKTCTRHAVAVGQMMVSALLIHISGGRIETHFHVFGSLAFLAFYRDWKVLISASAIAVADDLLRGIFWPQSVFGVLTASNWRWIEHAAWVVFEDIFLIGFCIQGVKEMQAAAHREARLESTNEIIESAIIERTAELRASEERFRSLSAASPVGIFQTDAEGLCTYTNARWQEISGLSAEESLGEGWSRTVHAEDKEAMLEEWARCAREGCQFSHEFRFLTPQGEIRWGYSRANVVRSPDGKVIGSVGTVEDITERRQREEQVRKLSRAVEQSPASVMITDRQGNIEYVNPKFTRLTGYTVEDVLGKNPRMLKSGETPIEDYEKLWETITAGGEWQGEFHNKKKNGELFWERASISPIFGLDGAITHFVGVKEDITERKKAQADLLQTTSEMTAIFKAMPDLLFRLDSEGTILSHKAGPTSHLYASPEVFLGKRMQDVLPAGVGEAFGSAFADVSKSGSMVSIEYALAINGREQIYEARIMPFLEKEIIVIAREITARKRAENDLKKSEEKFRALLESASESIVTVDSRGIITLVNARAEEMFGYKREEMLGQPTEILIPERFRSKHPSHRAEYMSAPRARPMGKGQELFGLRKNGTEFPIEISLSYVKGDEGLTVMSFITDITERKLGEQTMRKSKETAEAATRAKSEFLANMSHEIRTPMNAVIGMTGLLLDTELTEEQKEFVETVRSSSDALLTIINDILDFSKVESGYLELEHHPFDLRDCIEESLDLIAAKAAEKGINLAYLIDANVPGAIVGDSTRLRQILVNLFSNAIKFTQEGEIIISVTARLLEDEEVKGCRGEEVNRAYSSPLHLLTSSPLDSSAALRYELHFTVEDTGIGIPADKMARLFHSFSQVDASTTRTYGGTGLGLAISKRLAEMMDGRMWAESETGRGSKFHFTIVASPAPARARVFQRAIQPQLTGRRVLIVDDNSTNRRILSLQAEGWGMKIIAASSGKEALDILSRNQTFDLAILDMQMPEMDGLQLASEIRRRYDQFPMVMLTSLGQRPAEMRDGLFSAFLNKPIKPSQLYDALIDIFDSQNNAPEISPASKQQYARIGDRLPLRILLAEDNAVNQKVAMRILERLGYRVDVVANGIEAIEAVTRQVYDVVLMDVQMPEMDGLEASRRITERWARGARPRIIAMTANAMQGDREECLAAGMDDYISKPVKVEELIAALERCGHEADIRNFEIVNDY